MKCFFKRDESPDLGKIILPGFQRALLWSNEDTHSSTATKQSKIKFEQSVLCGNIITYESVDTSEWTMLIDLKLGRKNWLMKTSPSFLHCVHA